MVEDLTLIGVLTVGANGSELRIDTRRDSLGTAPYNPLTLSMMVASEILEYATSEHRTRASQNSLNVSFRIVLSGCTDYIGGGGKIWGGV